MSMEINPDLACVYETEKNGTKLETGSSKVQVKEREGRKDS